MNFGLIVKSLRENHHIEGKRAERDGYNVEHMWEQVKRAMAESARELHGSVRVGGKDPKSVWWSNEINAEFRRKSQKIDAYKRAKKKRERL